MVGEPRPAKWLESQVQPSGWRAMSFAGKAAGKHGKDSGGKGHNTWRENMRALWSNYEAGPDGLAYGLWLAQLQHVAATTYQEPPVPNESFRSHLDRCYNKSSHNRYEEFVEGLAAQYYTGALAQSLAEASFNKDMAEKPEKKADEPEKKSVGRPWHGQPLPPAPAAASGSQPAAPASSTQPGNVTLQQKAMEKEQEERKAAEKEAEEEKRRAADKEVEEKKKLLALQELADKQAKDKKEAAEKEAEEKKKEAEKEAEEKKAALARLHAWKATQAEEEKKRAAEKEAEEKKKAAEKEAAEEKKKAAEKEAEEKKKAADKEAKEKKEAAEKEAKEKKEAAESTAGSGPMSSSTAS